jgi:hypothetical protein
MTDGKAQRPEGSAEREARSEPIPTPEGQGGGEALIEWLTGLVNEGGDAPIEMPIRDMKTLLALLSSPRVEEVRREAFEEAAKVAEALAAELARRRMGHASGVAGPATGTPNASGGKAAAGWEARAVGGRTKTGPISGFHFPPPLTGKPW